MFFCMNVKIIIPQLNISFDKNIQLFNPLPEVEGWSIRREYVDIHSWTGYLVHQMQYLPVGLVRPEPDQRTLK